jgi:hypothetical protein
MGGEGRGWMGMTYRVQKPCLPRGSRATEGRHRSAGSRATLGCSSMYEPRHSLCRGRRRRCHCRCPWDYPCNRLVRPPWWARRDESGSPFTGHDGHLKGAKKGQEGGSSIVAWIRPKGRERWRLESECSWEVVRRTATASAVGRVVCVALRCVAVAVGKSCWTFSRARKRPMVAWRRGPGMFLRPLALKGRGGG